MDGRQSADLNLNHAVREHNIPIGESHLGNLELCTVPRCFAVSQKVEKDRSTPEPDLDEPSNSKEDLELRVVLQSYYMVFAGFILRSLSVRSVSDDVAQSYCLMRTDWSTKMEAHDCGFV